MRVRRERADGARPVASRTMSPARPPKSFLLSAELSEYLVSHGTPPDAAQAALIEETAALGAVAGMQIAPEQGAFLTVLTRLINARNAIEIGTFTGYSALCIARGLPADGRLTCCDVSEEWTAVGRRAWNAAGVGDRIDLRIAPALDTIAALPAEPAFDLAFIDADKPNYANYFDALLPKIRPNGVILVDNVLWDGRVLQTDAADENTVAIRAFNDKVAHDDRVETVMLPIADGLTLCRKR
jgi:caffeoyl-CoA O-methyltransferase